MTGELEARSRHLSLTHPLLFGIVPILYVYAQNTGELELAALFRPLFVITGVLLAVLFLMLRFSRHTDRLAVLLSGTIALTFSYDALRGSIERLLPLDLKNAVRETLGRLLPFLGDYEGFLALTLMGLAWLALGYWVLFRPIPRATHGLLIVMAGTMLSISLLRIGLDILETPRRVPPVVSRITVPVAGKTHPGRPPDIFYIVPDRYPSAHVLRAYFDFDNRAFLEALQKRGFFIARDAHANYLKTAPSLGASLNLQYVNRLSEAYGESTDDWQPVFDLVRDHEVQRVLRERGYRYVHMGSWWPPTNSNPHADVNFSGRTERLTAFEDLVVRTTPIPALLKRYRSLRGESQNSLECERESRKLEFLTEVGGDPQPVFVFAHFLVPHKPMKFAADGTCIDGPEPTPSERWPHFRKAFVEQVKFMNSELLEIFDAQRVKNPYDFVFIIQADEGPFPLEYHLREDELDWERADEDQLVTKFGIINALYFPGGTHEGLHPGSSPVNNFRHVFNHVFDAGFPLLEERAYIHKDGHHIFRFTDVTEVLARARVEGEDPTGLSPRR